MRSMWQKARIFYRELRTFAGIVWRFGYRRLYAAFSMFERGKRVVTGILYRQRGRFARPFLHTAMGGLVAMSITLAPVLASTFPGVVGGVADEVSGVVEPANVADLEMSTVVSDKVRDKVMDYEVKPGDTLTGIAAKFGISGETIKWENNITSVNQLKPGQVLRILPVTGVLHRVGRGETVYSIAKKYSANPQAIADFPFNTFADNETFALEVGQDLIVPDGRVPSAAPYSGPASQNIAQRTPNAGAVSATGQFVWPIGGVITQRFSWYHRGIDIATGYGTPVVAADSGTVTAAGWPDNSGYGNKVVISHGGGTETWYGHLSRVDVVIGQTVKRGDRIGLEGSTGRSTGPHLHFEVRKNGAYYNPLDYLK